MLIWGQDTRSDSKVRDDNHFPQELYKLGWQKEAHTYMQTKILTKTLQIYVALPVPPLISLPPTNKIQRR